MFSKRYIVYRTLIMCYSTSVCDTCAVDGFFTNVCHLLISERINVSMALLILRCAPAMSLTR